jgi:hypothetical protein
MQWDGEATAQYFGRDEAFMSVKEPTGSREK